MNITKKTFVNLGKSLSPVLLIIILLTGSERVLASSNQSLLISGVQVMPVSAAATLWAGTPKGYVSQGNPTNDEVAFLVTLGRVQAAIGRVNSHDKESEMTNPFTANVLTDYMLIDPFVSGKSLRSLSLQPLLSELAAPETFAILVGTNRDQRQERNALSVKLRDLILRVDGIVTERFPSTRSSALAISALYREAGELLVTALSNDGQILDISKYRDALQLMEASLRLQVKKVTACERSRNAIKQLKNRGPLGDLLDRLIVVTEAGTLDANAGDVFAAAERLEQLGNSLPSSDKQICQ